MTEPSMFPDLEIIPPVFVFGSNLRGRHGAGAALWARQHRGAIYGQGKGHQGNSYAIPTKGAYMETLGTDEIAGYVTEFLSFALSHPELMFQVTPIGCGLAGYKPKDIAWMFDLPPPRNLIMPDEFKAIIG